MKNPTNPGMNRTGMATSPVLSSQLIAAAKETEPSMAGDERAVAAVRISYARGAEPMGTMPPPGSLKELATTAMKALKGEKPTVFIDKLGERLAFERSGTRLYEALLSKFDAFGTWRGGPTRQQLEEIHAEEMGHFAMLHEAMIRLGSDPTAITPSANLHANLSEGILKVVLDPRADLRQSLEGILLAELADNDCWENLIDLAVSLDQDELGALFEQALSAEQRHLRRVRTWIGAALSEDALGGMNGRMTSRTERGERGASSVVTKRRPVMAKTSRKRRGP